MACGSYSPGKRESFRITRVPVHRDVPLKDQKVNSATKESIYTLYDGLDLAMKGPIEKLHCECLSGQRPPSALWQLSSIEKAPAILMLQLLRFGTEQGVTNKQEHQVCYRPCLCYVIQLC